MENSSPFIMSVSPESVDAPYEFASTKIKVYSLEEALYHCYHYYDESMTDFFNGALSQWVSFQLGLPFAASRMNAIAAGNEPLTNQFIEFLSIVDYFSDKELSELKTKIFAWENRNKWMQLKEEGDVFYRNGQSKKAAACYKEALQYTEDPLLYNNLGLAYLSLRRYKEGENALIHAYELMPNRLDIIFNIVYAMYLQNDFDDALKMLRVAERMEVSPELYFYYGLLYDGLGKKTEAKNNFMKAVSLGDFLLSPPFLVEILIEERNYEQACSVLAPIEAVDVGRHHYYMALLLESGGNLAEAIKKMEAALLHKNDDSAYWVFYASLLRKSKELVKAASAINKALALSPENEEALLCLARIKKEHGKIEEYKSILSTIIEGWKDVYRKITE